MKKELYLITAFIMLISTVNAFEFCENGIVGESELRIISVDDMMKENSEVWVWKNNEEVELEVRIQNRADENRNYIAELVFMEGNDEVELARNSEDLIEKVSLNSKKRTSIAFNFKTKKDVEEGDYELFVKLYREGNENKECVENSEIKVEVKKINICSGEEISDDKLKIRRINDYTKNTEEKWVWRPGSDAKVAVEVKNRGLPEGDFKIELVFLDEEGNEISIVEDEKDLITKTRLEKGEENEVALDFELKTNIEEGEYLLYAKAYDENDKDICISLQAEEDSNPLKVEIEIADIDVQIKNVAGSKVIEKGTKITYTVEVMNIGSKDQEKVNVIMYSSRLKIKEEVEINNLDSGAIETITFNAQVPTEVNITRDRILFTLEFDYDSQKEFYRKNSNEEEDFKLNVELIENKNVLNNETESKDNINEKINETREEFLNESLNENETGNHNTLITSNAIGNSGKSNISSWLYIFLAVVAVTGLLVFYKKKKGNKNYETKEYIEPRFTTRKYTAALHE